MFMLTEVDVVCEMMEGHSQMSRQKALRVYSHTNLCMED